MGENPPETCTMYDAQPMQTISGKTNRLQNDIQIMHVPPAEWLYTPIQTTTVIYRAVGRAHIEFVF